MCRPPAQPPALVSGSPPPPDPPGTASSWSAFSFGPGASLFRCFSLTAELRASELTPRQVGLRAGTPRSLLLPVPQPDPPSTQQEKVESTTPGQGPAVCGSVRVTTSFNEELSTERCFEQSFETQRRDQRLLSGRTARHPCSRPAGAPPAVQRRLDLGTRAQGPHFHLRLGLARWRILLLISLLYSVHMPPGQDHPRSMLIFIAPADLRSS